MSWTRTLSLFLSLSWGPQLQDDLFYEKVQPKARRADADELACARSLGVVRRRRR